MTYWGPIPLPSLVLPDFAFVFVCLKFLPSPTSDRNKQRNPNRSGERSTNLGEASLLVHAYWILTDCAGTEPSLGPSAILLELKARFASAQRHPPLLNVVETA